MFGASHRNVAKTTHRLRDMAQRLRVRHTRSVIARESLDHVAFLLTRAAERDAPDPT